MPCFPSYFCPVWICVLRSRLETCESITCGALSSATTPSTACRPAVAVPSIGITRWCPLVVCLHQGRRTQYAIPSYPTSHRGTSYRFLLAKIPWFRYHRKRYPYPKNQPPMMYCCSYRPLYPKPLPVPCKSEWSSRAEMGEGNECRPHQLWLWGTPAAHLHCHQRCRRSKGLDGGIWTRKRWS